MHWPPGFHARFFEDYKKNENKDVQVDEILGSEEAKRIVKESLVGGRPRSILRCAHAARHDLAGCLAKSRLCACLCSSVHAALRYRAHGIHQTMHRWATQRGSGRREQQQRAWTPSLVLLAPD